MVIPAEDTSTLEAEIQANIELGTAVLTDGHAGYDRLDRLGYKHEAVQHSQGIYVLGKDIHTNTIEGFWSQLKRSIDDSYHRVTAAVRGRICLPVCPPKRRTEPVLDDDGEGYF